MNGAKSFQNADIALGALSVMAERENVIDFTVPYYDLVGITILMKKPKAKTQLFKFLTVLDSSVWGCIIAAYFVTRYNLIKPDLKVNQVQLKLYAFKAS